MSAPLTPLSMAILLALLEGEQHGYALMQEIGSRTGETPGTGSLYSALQRLTDEGLIIEAPKRADVREDQRRKYFRITGQGKAHAKAEAVRLLAVVTEAQRKSLIPGLAGPGRSR